MPRVICYAVISREVINNSRRPGAVARARTEWRLRGSDCRVVRWQMEIESIGLADDSKQRIVVLVLQCWPARYGPCCQSRVGDAGDAGGSRWTPPAALAVFFCPVDTRFSIS